MMLTMPSRRRNDTTDAFTTTSEYIADSALQYHIVWLNWLETGWNLADEMLINEILIIFSAMGQLDQALCLGDVDSLSAIRGMKFL